VVVSIIWTPLEPPPTIAIVTSPVPSIFKAWISLLLIAIYQPARISTSIEPFASAPTVLSLIIILPVAPVLMLVVALPFSALAPTKLPFKILIFTALNFRRASASLEKATILLLSTNRSRCASMSILASPGSASQITELALILISSIAVSSQRYASAPIA